MPGFRHCHWCHGKGCIACDAEERKWKERQAKFPPPSTLELVASLLRTTPQAILAAKEEVERGSPTNPRFIPSDLPGWNAEQFRYCPKCNGTGCLECPAERARFVRTAIMTAPEWRPGDIRDVRDAVVMAEAEREKRGLDSRAEDQVEADFLPLLDAEYARQFPDGPKPLASFSVSDVEVTGWVG